MHVTLHRLEFHESTVLCNIFLLLHSVSGNSITYLYVQHCIYLHFIRVWYFIFGLNNILIQQKFIYLANLIKYCLYFIFWCTLFMCQGVCVSEGAQCDWVCVCVCVCVCVKECGCGRVYVWCVGVCVWDIMCTCIFYNKLAMGNSSWSL